MRPKTPHLKPAEHTARWYLVDAEGKILGRLARDIAMVLMGKHNPQYSPHFLSGDGVIVVNCEKVRVTGRKAETKTYARYTGYPGGHREDSFQEWLEEHPERILQKAVQRMLPKNKLARQMLKRLKVYAGPEHPHTAQKPEPFPLS